MAKIITRGEVNALREGTFDSDLTKAVLYSEVTEGEIAQYFVVESVNSATGIEYTPTQAILETDIRVKADVTVQIEPRLYTVFSTETSIIFDITTTSETPLVNPVYSVAVARYDGGEPTSASINQDGTEFIITFPANTDHSSKEILGRVKVTVDGNDFYSNQSTVSQNAAGYIEYNPTSMTVESTATTATVGFTTNCTAIGLSAVPTGGTAEIVGGNVNVTFPKNTSGQAYKVVREFELSGYTPDGVVMYARYRIGQTPASATTLTFVYTGNTLPSLSGSTSEFTLELTRASLSAVTVPAGCSYSTGGTLTAPTLTFAYPQNTGSVQASYEITVRANDVYDRTLTASTTIQQEAAAATNMTINYTGGYKSQASGSTNEFTITLTNATFSGATANNGATVTTGGTPDNPTITVNYPAYTGTGERTITVTAYAIDIYGETIVDTATFTQFAEKLEVTPATASIGTTATTQLTAIYRHVSGGVVVETDVTSGAGTVWASNNTTAAEVNASGYVTAHNNTANAKTVTITATYNGLSDTSVITVAQGIQNWRNFRILIGGTEGTANQPLYLNPSSVNARLLTFIDEYRNNTKIQSWGVSNSSDWTYDDPSSSITHSVDQYDAQVVNPVYESGTYYPTQRTAKVTATVVQGSTTFTAEKYIYVEPEGREEYIIESTPASVSIPDGGSQQLLIKYYVVTDGVKDAGTDVTTSVTYVSNNPDVTVTTGGTVSGTNTGTTAITANIAVSYIGTSGTTVPVTVAAPGYTYYLEVTADTASITYTGTANCTAVYVQKQGETVISRTDVTNDCSWVVDNTDYATVSSGVVTGTNSDTSFGHTVKVQATYNGYSDDVDIFIGKAPVVTYRLEIEMTENYSDVTRGTGNLYIFNTPNSSYAEFAVYYSRYEDNVLVPGSKQNVTAQSELGCTGLVIGPSVASSSTSSDYITFTNINSGYEYAGVTFWAEYGGMTTNVPFELLANVIPFHVILSANTYSTSHDGSVTFSAWTEYSDGRTGEKAPIDMQFDGSLEPTSGTSEVYLDVITGSQFSGTSIVIYADNRLTTDQVFSIHYMYNKEEGGIIEIYQSNDVEITVAGRDEVITHDLLVSAATSTITSTGNTQCAAVYRTFRDGVEDATARVVVTNSSTWSITSGSDYATVGNTGLVTGTNSTGTAQQVTVQASYVGDATYTESTTITVGAAVITHDLEVVTSSTSSVSVSGDTYIVDNPGLIDFVFYYNTYVNGIRTQHTDVTSSATETFTVAPSQSTFVANYEPDFGTYVLTNSVDGYTSAGTVMTVSYSGLSESVGFVFLAEVIPLTIILSANTTSTTYNGNITFSAWTEYSDGRTGAKTQIDICPSEGVFGDLLDSPTGFADNHTQSGLACIVNYRNYSLTSTSITMTYDYYGELSSGEHVFSNSIVVIVGAVPVSDVRAYLTLNPSSTTLNYGGSQIYDSTLSVYYGSSLVISEIVPYEVSYSVDSQYATVNGSTVTNNNNSSSDVNTTITGVYTGSTYASYIPAGISASGTAQLSLVKQFVPTLTFDVSGTSGYTITVNGSEFVNPSQVAAGTQVNWNVSAPHFTAQSGSFQMPSNDTAITVNLVQNEFPLYMKVEFDTGATSSATISDAGSIPTKSVVVGYDEWGLLGYYASSSSIDVFMTASNSTNYGPNEVSLNDTEWFDFITTSSVTYPYVSAYYFKVTPYLAPVPSTNLNINFDAIDITVSNLSICNLSNIMVDRIEVYDGLGNKIQTNSLNIGSLSPNDMFESGLTWSSNTLATQSGQTIYAKMYLYAENGTSIAVSDGYLEFVDGETIHQLIGEYNAQESVGGYYVMDYTLGTFNSSGTLHFTNIYCTYEFTGGDGDIKVHYVGDMIREVGGTGFFDVTWSNMSDSGVSFDVSNTGISSPVIIAGYGPTGVTGSSGHTTVYVVLDPCAGQGSSEKFILTASGVTVFGNEISDSDFGTQYAAYPPSNPYILLSPRKMTIPATGGTLYSGLMWEGLDPAYPIGISANPTQGISGPTSIPISSTTGLTGVTCTFSPNTGSTAINYVITATGRSAVDDIVEEFITITQYSDSAVLFELDVDTDYYGQGAGWYTDGNIRLATSAASNYVSPNNPGFRELGEKAVYYSDTTATTPSVLAQTLQWMQVRFTLCPEYGNPQTPEHHYSPNKSTVILTAGSNQFNLVGQSGETSFFTWSFTDNIISQTKQAYGLQSVITITAKNSVLGLSAADYPVKISVKWNIQQS